MAKTKVFGSEQQLAAGASAPCRMCGKTLSHPSLIYLDCECGGMVKLPQKGACAKCGGEFIKHTTHHKYCSVKCAPGLKEYAEKNKRRVPDAPKKKRGVKK